MSYIPAVDRVASYTLDGLNRVSQGITLFDGKILNAEDTNRFDTKGTGTATYSNSSIVMSVTAGQYVVRQGKFFTPYFSGKPQKIEPTAFNFQNQTGVIKRIGYFSSSAVAPYSAALDGVWIESDGANHRLITSNNGTVTHNIVDTDWDNYELVASYDWSKFTVMSVDFLWLGGAGLRFFMVVDGEFKLIHTISNHAGVADTLIMRSPQQPVRYEIRSTTGAGSMTSVCSQVTSEGGANEQGQETVVSRVSMTTASTGVIYPVCAGRKIAAERDRSVVLSSVSVGVTSAANESEIIRVHLNPTLSAPLTYARVGDIDAATGDGVITITDIGRVIMEYQIVRAGESLRNESAALRTLPVDIDNTMGQLVLSYEPTTGSQVISGSMTFLEY